MLTRVKIFKSCQHTTENATKLLLFQFLMAHCCKQLRATGLSREESIPHAAQVGIFSLVRIIFQKRQKRCSLDVCFSVLGIFRVLLICFVWYILTQYMRKSERLYRVDTGMVTVVLLKKKMVALYFLSYSKIIANILGWLFCKVNTVIQFGGEDVSVDHFTQQIKVRYPSNVWFSVQLSIQVSGAI